jgi:pentatricopeptide repeat protein
LIPDIVTYNTLIDGYCKAFDTVSTDEVVNKMYATGWDPDITTYNIRLHGLCTGRKMSRAVMMLEELISAGVVPDTVTYNTVMNGVCTDVLERAMIVTAKLLKMAFVPNVVTANLLLSHFCKQGMPEKTIMWGQKLNEISFGFDEISIKLMDRAYRNIQDNVDVPKPPPEKSLFLDFLMYVTYDYLSRNSLKKNENQGSLKRMEIGYGGS